MNSKQIADQMHESQVAWYQVIKPFIGKRIISEGVEFELVSCNDLGTLYWQKVGKPSKHYVVAGWDISIIRTEEASNDISR